MSAARTRAQSEAVRQAIRKPYLLSMLYTQCVGKWVHLATAPDQIAAEIWVDILRQEGITAMIRPSDAVSFLGITAVGCRVQAREEDIERAREILGVDAE